MRSQDSTSIPGCYFISVIFFPPSLFGVFFEERKAHSAQATPAVSTSTAPCKQSTLCHGGSHLRFPFGLVFWAGSEWSQMDPGKDPLEPFSCNDMPHPVVCMPLFPSKGLSFNHSLWYCFINHLSFSWSKTSHKTQSEMLFMHLFSRVALGYIEHLLKPVSLFWHVSLLTAFAGVRCKGALCYLVLDWENKTNRLKKNPLLCA